jgi:hypothetical protein
MELRDTFTMEGVYERVNGHRIQHQTLFRHRKPGEALTVRNHDDRPSMHYIHAQKPCHPLEEDVCDLLCHLLASWDNRLQLIPVQERIRISAGFWRPLIPHHGAHGLVQETDE